MAVARDTHVTARVHGGRRVRGTLSCASHWRLAKFVETSLHYRDEASATCGVNCRLKTDRFLDSTDSFVRADRRGPGQCYWCSADAWTEREKKRTRTLNQS
ncbi:uncharacterized protein LOC143343655 [Colletes latitarsis]|uniref:uncharacterized protein LOC143343655 n=1 Tax=Colletes latitarsis TaxID=2605962 RepID=UPI00403529F6